MQQRVLAFVDFHAGFQEVGIMRATRVKDRPESVYEGRIIFTSTPRAAALLSASSVCGSGTKYAIVM